LSFESGELEKITLLTCIVFLIIFYMLTIISNKNPDDISKNDLRISWCIVFIIFLFMSVAPAPLIVFIGAMISFLVTTVLFMVGTRLIRFVVDRLW
jgi:hypothetical protein